MIQPLCGYAFRLLLHRPQNTGMVPEPGGRDGVHKCSSVGKGQPWLLWLGCKASAGTS